MRVLNNKRSLLKVAAELSRIIVGITFLFSGFVKAVDPLGFTYKIQDYLIAFQLTDLFALALPAAIAMVVLEFLIGLFLLMGIYRRITSILATIFMAVFLPLTLWIAIGNPVEDCGCFGDALIISNWATFYKNIILSVCALFLLFNYKLLTPLFSIKAVKFAAGYAVIFAVTFAIYNTVKLPVIDFRPFKIGSDIAEQMKIDPEKGDVVENIFIYSKNGVEKEFTEDDYPWNDSTWIFVDMQSRIIREGEKPKIEDFHLTLYVYDEEESIYSPEEDITDAILEHPGYSFLMVSCFLTEMSSKHLEDFKAIEQFAGNNETAFYLLTASSEDEIKKWSQKNGNNFTFVSADERMLKTMIRTNPGLVLLHNGKVINKWDEYSLPDINKKTLSQFDKSSLQKTIVWRKLLIILLLLAVPLLVIKLIDKK